jgi:hypothetical protein
MDRYCNAAFLTKRSVTTVRSSRLPAASDSVARRDNGLLLFAQTFDAERHDVAAAK